MVFVFLSLFIASAHAIDVFHSNCTLPAGNFSFATAPNTRGTLEILWTSLATIVACVFTVLHLNVPEQRLGRDPGWRGDLYWAMKNTWTSLKYSVLMIFIPELMLGKSGHDLMTAKYYLKHLHESVPETKTEWTLQHMLFAEMGGFVLTYNPQTEHETPVEMQPNGSSESTPLATIDYALHKSTKDSAVAASTPEMSNDTPVFASHDVERNVQYAHRLDSEVNSLALWHLDCWTLVWAIKENIVPCKAPLTSAEIMDKSKADPVSKTVAIFQICYFVLGVVVRASHQLAVSPLELGACAFVPYAIAIYYFSHCKAKSLQAAVRITHISANHVADLAREENKVNSIFFWRLSRSLHGSWIPNHCFQNERRSLHGSSSDHGAWVGLTWIFLLPALVSIPLGGIHIAGWNFDFPTQTDALLWQAASIVITASLPCLVLLSFIIYLMDEIIRLEVSNWVSKYIVVVPLLVLFLIARMILIIEMFRTLAYLPSGSYIATWTNNVPHIG